MRTGSSFSSGSSRAKSDPGVHPSYSATTEVHTGSGESDVTFASPGNIVVSLSSVVASPVALGVASFGLDTKFEVAANFVG